jgi:hypothetical protein
MASVVFTAFGIWMGYYFLDRNLKLEQRKIFTSGLDFYRHVFLRFRKPNVNLTDH